MRNPFVQMALMASAMSMAFKEYAMRAAGMSSLPTGRSRTRIPGSDNPAGSKLIRKFYRNRHGSKGTYQESLKWYKGLK